MAFPPSSSAASEVTESIVARHMQLAISLFKEKRMEEAYATFLTVLDSEPNNPQVFLYLGLIALSAGLREDAQVFFDQAVEFSPERANAQAVVGQLCLEADELPYAEQYLQLALTDQPKFIEAQDLLAQVWRRQGRHEEALRLLSPTLDDNPQAAPQVLPALMQLTAELGDLTQERALCVRGVQYSHLQGRALELLPWCDDASASALREEAGRFGRAYPGAMTSSSLPAGRRKRLRIGFVIGDLAADDVRYRVEPLVRQLDVRYFETVIFAKGTFAGETAHRIRLMTDRWVSLEERDIDATDQAIRGQNIDVLVNVEAHRSMAALKAFIRRSAPLQINWTSPPLTTGLRNMDAVIGHRWLGPAETARGASYSERIVVLPVPPAAYEFPVVAEDAVWPRAEGRGFTFGCLVPLNHISEKTWQAWVEILRQSPGACLRLNTAGFEDVARRHVLDRLASGGIDADRVVWCDAGSSAARCEAWRTIDLGLCPLTGDSSYDALLGIWMNVPSIACRGTTPWGDIPALALRELGLDAYVADAVPHYIELATRLANSPVEQNGTVGSLRGKLMRSPFVDTQGYADLFGRALLDLWRQQGGVVEVAA